MKRKTKYNAKTKEAEITYFDDGLIAVGRAKLHPEDEEFGTRLTGLQIADYRAEAKMWYKKALKELDTVIYISNRYKHNKTTKAFCDYLTELAGEYFKRAITLDECLEDFLNVKDEHYALVRNIREGKVASMEFKEDLTDFISDELKKAIDGGM